MIGDNEAMEDLAIAIIVNVANNYREALRSQKRNPLNKEIWSRVQELEGFFCTDWYKTLTNVDGDYIVSRIKREVEEESI